MFIEKLKKMFKKEEMTVDVARANYKMYEDKLKAMKDTYISEFCKTIKIEARKGYKSATTKSTASEWMTHEFLDEMKDYFEQRGFVVRKETDCCNFSKSWLRIIWE